MARTKTYTFTQLSNLVARNINLPSGKYDINIINTGRGKTSKYKFIFTKRKGRR